MRLLGILLVCLCCACVSPEDARSGADRAAYALLEQRREELFGASGEFRIDPPTDSLRQRLVREEISSLPGLNLVDCLEISAENSRDYQSRKEQLYSSALALTLEQWNYGILFDFGADASRSGSEGSDQQNDSVDFGLGMNKLLGSGANVVASVGRSLFRVVNDGDGWTSLREASFSITQPLLGGSAREVIREPLTQAERDLVYQVRSFERYRSTFALDVAARYFQLIETMDTVGNEEANFEGLILLSLRNHALAEAGQLSDIEADEARQDELESENRLLNLRESLDRQLDDFKLYLGLPVEIELGLVRSSMDESQQAEQSLLDLDEEHAFAIAIDNRLDYLNTADAVLDAERKVRVAEEALKLGLDLDVSAVNTGANPTSWSAGFSFDLPIDRIPERNAYRNSLIALEVARRAQQEMSDTLRADLRNEMRQLGNTRISYQIQLNAVELARQRVESTELSLSAGRSDTRAALDARRSLVSAQNSATSALVDHLLARLSLYNQLELLRIGPQGFELEVSALTGTESQG